MGFIFEAIFELLWILIYHFFSLMFVMTFEFIKLIPIWIWITLIVVILLYKAIKVYLENR